VNYFHVSFGKQDKLQRAVLGIKEQEGLCVDDPVSKVFKHLVEAEDRNTIRELNYFNKEVPWQFLSPWIKAGEKEVYQLSQ
jgi:hypothetical protein